MLLVATPSAAPGSTFHQAVILVVDAEPNGIVTGICLNRPLESRVIDTSALALLFVGEPDARAFWGGPMGSDPAVLAQFSATDGLEWFHLPLEQRRPFPLPDVGVIAVAEHTGPFADRVLRSRLFVGLCVWARGQLPRELSQEAWLVRSVTPDIVFSHAPDRLWSELSAG